MGPMVATLDALPLDNTLGTGVSLDILQTASYLICTVACWKYGCLVHYLEPTTCRTHLVVSNGSRYNRYAGLSALCNAFTEGSLP
jgi:hypothetical protein